MIYFAYGSLVNRDQLLGLCPSATPLRTARIPHQALCFTGRSRRWGGGTATVGLAPASDLWGALYEIDEDDRASIERSGEEDGYVWSFTTVVDAEQDRLKAGMLIKIRDLQHMSPSETYFEVLKTGWRQWGLNADTFLSRSLPTL